jgi:uncharacterized membrane protein HdeD (DUF308 family)
MRRKPSKMPGAANNGYDDVPQHISEGEITPMIIAGIVLLLIAWLLPDVLPVEPGILHVCHVLGVIAVVVGLVLFVFGHFANRTLGGRRYWY